jgi:hypothetical protein
MRKNLSFPQWFGELTFRGGDENVQREDKCESFADKAIARDIFIPVIYTNAPPEREDVLIILPEVFGEGRVLVLGSQRGSAVDKFKVHAQSQKNYVSRIVLVTAVTQKSYCNPRLSVAPLSTWPEPAI